VAEIVSYGRNLGAKLGGDRYLKIGYKDLALRAEDVGRMPLNFLSISPDRVFKGFLRSASLMPAGIHKREYSSETVRVPVQVCGALLRELGYR
jgi:hypothetical protein